MTPAAALFGFISITKDEYPKWLPDLFEEAEIKYHDRHQFSSMLEESVKNFWKRHLYHDLPELEQYRFAFSNSYFS
ncbi:hypothetical protein TVAGG3_0524830 [Trichomonas vaginalis G3]|uniref:hypothetical protein n=1 Tax=Trichomonas vaginalis (strain ATCC PRA-98 / G3) TaxID=412133 RepID=UPI0021E5C4BC|nr:hypothetical protein TVAGG3_0519840 [Trichomonas vaginalis G3]XP_051095017.1 hypothetical protein TVAGG3_0519910 [Trichomonas vaginalis G3]XP_051095018.1 hypothetical protein TVAGG3_0519970 [Trichomonas vaginalis G3]XP_051095019.1 hypothetical protein TVAGG3_0520020 [Trichomonas vaginalis G3]XP_051095020.1 hypothetical protein TVAGG3_0520070 [Trichomonas vaginalis G3]XP_051095021.1 hypothetical protein TVAGG3_0520120 [Trichomonas vaginalis G3]XP_051095022.1 hypothetical protein TVAGG3_0520